MRKSTGCSLHSDGLKANDGKVTLLCLRFPQPLEDKELDHKIVIFNPKAVFLLLMKREDIKTKID